MTFHEDWFCENIPLWKKLLRKYKNKKKLLFLEIGCYEGRATLWLLENILTHPTSKIIVIDTFKGHIGYQGNLKRGILNEFKENLATYLSKSPSKSKIIIHKGYSGEILRRISIKSRFDFIYIDGSHIAKDVLEDSILSWRLLKPGGIMIFDDYGWRCYKDPKMRPDLAINSFLMIYGGSYKLLSMGWQVAIMKEFKEVNNQMVLRKPYLPTNFYIGKIIIFLLTLKIKISYRIRQLFY